MNKSATNQRFRTLVFFLLYFFWDRFIESFLPFLPFGVFRPVVIIFLWIHVFFNWNYLRSSVSNFKKLKKWFYFITLLAFFLLMRSLYLGIPFLAIVYTYFQHLGFLPIVLLVLSFSDLPTYTKKILNIMLMSSFLLGAGVIVDAYLGMNNIFAVEGVENMTRLGIQGIRRGDFTIGSTNVFVTLSIGLVSIYLLVSKFGYSIFKALFGLVFIVVAMYASGSRASLILGAVLAVIIVMKFLKKKRYFPTTGITLTILVAGGAMALQIGILNFNVDKIERFESLTSEDTEGNLGRFQSWGDGLVLMSDTNNIYGSGVGTTNPKVEELFGSGLSLEDGFESSFFSRYYEGGIVGLILFLLPLFCCLVAYKKKLFDVLNVWMVLLYFNFLIAPTAQGYPSNLIIYFALSLCIFFKADQESIRRKDVLANKSKF